MQVRQQVKMEDSKITFWEFISQHDIEIPIIQRDYAQGRKGEVFLRKTFLASLKQALDNNLPNGEKILKLDFVYGSEENGKLNPLDGQQRLTTLWLLHWYIALKAGTLADAGDTLRRFSYETRISSREFCNQLCQSDNFQSYKTEDSVSNYIQTQTWFYSMWKQDPTIQSMLRMIAGEEDKDGLEKIFIDLKQADFQHYWQNLISEAAPIVFYKLCMKDFGLSDDLYIKMNARGKQLTAFENFKADLVGFMHEKARGDNKWEELLNSIKGIPIKLDTVWANFFWKHRSSTASIDEIYFTFLNRFFWNEMFIAKDAEGKYILKVGKGKKSNGEEASNIENESLSYTYLNTDRFDKYEGLEPYLFAEKSIPMPFFREMEIILDRYIQYTGEISAVSRVGEFDFIPKYEHTDKSGEIKIASITQIQRIVFFAVCKYFKEGEADVLSIKRWMRVVWNTVSCEGEDGRSQIRSTEAVRKVMDYLSKIDSHDVYISLCRQQPEADPSAIGSRWNEEISKSKQIWDKDSNDLRVYQGDCIRCDGTQYKTWEEIIIDAENYAFFKGAIRFLYRDEAGKDNWGDFDTKWKNAQKFFKMSQLPKESAMNNDFRNAQLLKSLISNFSADNFKKTLWWNHRTFNNKPESWMYYLLNDNICSPVHHLLMNGAEIKPLIALEDFTLNTIYLLSNTGLLNFVREQIPNSWIRVYHNHMAIFPSDKGVNSLMPKNGISF